MMWKWLQYVFGGPHPSDKEFYNRSLEELIGVTPKPPPDKTTKTKSSSQSNINDYDFDRKMLAVVEERKRHEEEIINGLNFEESFDKAIVYLGQQLYSTGNDRVIMNESDVGLTTEAFRVFSERFVPVLRDKGMSVELVNSGLGYYIRVMSDGAKQYLEKLASKVESKNETVVTSAYR